MPKINPYQQYDNVTFGTADPASLVVTTYSAAVRALKEIQRCMREGDTAGRVKNVDLAFALISELRKSLNPEQGGEIADRLEALYAFFTREITVANAYEDPDRLDPIITMMSELRETWVELRKKVQE